jgi:hypothetical protein
VSLSCQVPGRANCWNFPSSFFFPFPLPSDDAISRQARELASRNRPGEEGASGRGGGGAVRCLVPVPLPLSRKKCPPFLAVNFRAFA